MIEKFADTRRPCYIRVHRNGEHMTIKGMFHCWFDKRSWNKTEGYFTEKVGIVELPSGRIGYWGTR